MKRKVTAKSLRVGQTIFGLSHPLTTNNGRWGVLSIAVNSDRAPICKPGDLNCHGLRIGYLKKSIGGTPGYFSYSRRALERVANFRNEVDDQQRLAAQTLLDKAVAQ